VQPTVPTTLESASNDGARGGHARCFAEALEAMPLALVVTRMSDGRVLHANQRAFATFGLSTTQLGEWTPVDFYVDPAERDAVLAELAQAGGRLLDREVRFRHASGGVFWALLSVQPSRLDGVTVLVTGIQDIQARKEMERRLRESEEHYRRLVEASPEGIVISDPAGRVTYFSPRAAELWRLPPGESPIGTSALDWLHPEERAVRDERRREALEGSDLPPGAPCRVFRWDRTAFWAQLTSVRLTDADGTVRGVMSLVRDVTSQVEAQEERDKLLAELQAASARITTLKGLVPICASCKRVRQDDGYWEQIETYVKERSDADFSHGICPDCTRRLYPEVADEVLGGTGDEPR